MESTATATAPSVTSVGLRYGLLIGLVSILLSFLTFSLKLQENWGMRLLSPVVLVVGIILGQREFKKLNAGFMSYGEGLGIAVLAGGVAGVLGAAFIYVYLTAIAPEFQQVILDKAREGMEARGTMSDEQLDQGMAMTRKFMTPIMLGSALLGSIFQALVIGLISSAFIKNEKPEFE